MAAACEGDGADHDWHLASKQTKVAASALQVVIVVVMMHVSVARDMWCPRQNYKTHTKLRTNNLGAASLKPTWSACP